MVAPAIQTKSQNIITSNSTSTVLTAPASIADNDLLLIVIGLDANPTAFVPPSGFTEITANNGAKAPSNRATLWAAYKIASTESGNYTVSWTTGEQGVANMYRINGSNLTSGNVIQDPNNENTGITSPSTALSFTTDTADTLALALHAIDRDRITNGQADGGTGWTTEDADESGSANGATLCVSRKTIGATSVTLDSTQALSTGDEWVTIQVGVRSIEPAVAAGIQSFQINNSSVMI